MKRLDFSLFKVFSFKPTLSNFTKTFLEKKPGFSFNIISGMNSRKVLVTVKHIYKNMLNWAKNILIRVMLKWAKMHAQMSQDMCKLYVYPCLFATLKEPTQITHTYIKENWMWIIVWKMRASFDWDLCVKKQLHMCSLILYMGGLESVWGIILCMNILHSKSGYHFNNGLNNYWITWVT